MDQQEYLKLSRDLQELAKLIPLNWGKIQNDQTDGKINMFNISSFEQLEKEIQDLNQPSKSYFRRRWFIWKCSQCDEYLFSQNENVLSNPNPRDQSYDIEFNKNPNLRFDLKGTVIPRKFRNEIDEIILNPRPMVEFFYDEQSKGVRNNFQNRLFVVHHSHLENERETYLRCIWEEKARIYAEYSKKINLHSNFIEYKGIKADVIFIFESPEKLISFKFFSI